MMKIRGTHFYSAVLIFLFLGAWFPLEDYSEKESILMQTIVTSLERYHFQPKQIDDEFSQEVFDLYLKRLDYGKRFLTQKDIVKLKPYQTVLDDQIMAGSYQFFDLSLEILEESIERSEGIYRELISQPFDVNIDEDIETDNENIPFAADEAALREHWRKLLKHRVLMSMLDEIEKDEELEEGAPRDQVQLEIDARQDVEETFDRYFKRIKKLKRSDRLSTYLNSITNIYDPHTGYFEPIDRENFDISMSGTLEGIGASLQTDGDLTKVVRIVPGGPAWKQKELDKDDYILKVAQDGEEPVDVTGMSLNDVIKMIRGPKGTKVSLTLKKVDGSIKVITIERDIVILEEGYARSLMLRDEDGEDGDPQIGYIYLPKFYADFAGNGGPSCSEDVEKEINKLKAAGAEGIILDLRNNGGGSLRDVVDMAGLFIEEGPVVQVKARGREPAVLSDRDPEVQYDGPLVVMVNHFSASASEILAAALQDYDRAVIIGSNSTYGKGTVQRFLDLDRMSSSHEVDELGQIKLTIQKFYRVNGGSTQLRGVTPDIVLPDNYHLITTGEKENDFPMAWSEIAAVPYKQDVARLNYLKKLQKNSEKRVQGNELFGVVLENAERLKEQRDDTMDPLDFNEFKAKNEAYKEEAEKFKDIFTPIEHLAVENLEVDMAHIQSDSSRIARNDDWVSRVQKDIYIEEALEVMEDMIQYN